MKFKDLNIGDSFDFISPENPSFYGRCVKISARRYSWKMTANGREETISASIGTMNATVYHVNDDAEYPLSTGETLVVRRIP